MYENINPEKPEKEQDREIGAHRSHSKDQAEP